jgi:hypothetical protein
VALNESVAVKVAIASHVHTSVRIVHDDVVPDDQVFRSRESRGVRTDANARPALWIADGVVFKKDISKRVVRRYSVKKLFKPTPFGVTKLFHSNPIVCSTDCSADSDDYDMSCNRWRLLSRLGSSNSEIDCSSHTLPPSTGIHYSRRTLGNR